MEILSIILTIILIILIRQILINKKADYKGLDHQIDTYFNVNIGRLKLREGSIENNLIQESSELWLVGSSYNLNIIKSDNELVYLKLTDNNEQKTVIERTENSELENTNFDVYTFGTFCGFTGTPPDKCQSMLDLVNSYNYDQLASWLKSINPEIATYGYIGLELLKKKGIIIENIESQRMIELSESDIQLNTCYGCIIGVTERIEDVLTTKNINQIYLSFQQSGWIK